MNKLEWEAKLAQVAEWEMPKLNATEKKQIAKGRKTKEDQYQDEHEQEFMAIFEGVNPTHTPVVTKIYSQPCTCDDCGKHCPNGRHKEKKIYEAYGHRHWREKCTTCGMSQNPFSKQFDLTVAEASSRWFNYLRDAKIAYKTELRESRGIVTYYPDSNNKT
jgi:hypothetical protein